MNGRTSNYNFTIPLEIFVTVKRGSTVTGSIPAFLIFFFVFWATETSGANNCEVKSNGPFMWIRNTSANHVNVFVNSRFQTLSARETVLDRAPVILTQPEGLTAETGKNAVFNVKVAAIPEASYQWNKNDVPLKGATTATLTLKKTGPRDEVPIP
jgi:hypothetical protein